MKHGVLTNARLVHETCKRGGFRTRAAMVTLTYKPGEVWNPRHLSHAMAACRKWHNRLGQKMSYVWVAEMQERGAVHYHVIFWLRHGYKLPKFDQRGWWPYGASKMEWARNGVGYVAKYASKGADGPAFPKGIRINGAGGLDLVARVEARYWRTPAEARDLIRINTNESQNVRLHGCALPNIKRIPGGRFDAVTGLMWLTPWRMLRINGDFYMTKVQLEDAQ